MVSLILFISAFLFQSLSVNYLVIARILFSVKCLFLAAAWKIVKSWLGPEAISKLKFASKAEVLNYIDPEYLPPHMGGTVKAPAFKYFLSFTQYSVTFLFPEISHWNLLFLITIS